MPELWKMAYVARAGGGGGGAEGARGGGRVDEVLLDAGIAQVATVAAEGGRGGA